MTEQKELKIQPRMEWNLIYLTTKELIETGKEVGIQPSKMVFVGGMACFFHLESVFGPRVVMNWRGTHDIDLVIFGHGGAQKFIERIQTSPFFEECLCESSHLPDRWNLEIKTKRGKGFFSGKELWTEVDLYGEKKGKGVTMNERLLLSKRLIYDPPVELNLKGGEIVTVPSLRDTLILKLDVLRYSHLRLKDRFDILGCLAIAEHEGVPFMEILRQVFNKIPHRQQLEDTKEVFRDLDITVAKKDFPEWWFGPSRDYLKDLKIFLKT